MIWQYRPFIEYLNAVDDLLESRYGITSNDTNLDMIAAGHEAGEAPVEIVEQIAEKYDLERIARGVYG